MVKIKRFFLGGLLIILSLGGDLSAQVTMTVEKELTTPWDGFGYNQWGFARQDDGNSFKPWDDQLWKTTEERILAIKPSLVRLPLMRQWFHLDDAGKELPIGTYNWNSKYMQSFYKIMDLYKKHNISVMSGLWHSAYDPQGREPNDFYQSQNFAILQADMIDYLVNTKGYTNIKYYTPTNEPLGSGLSSFSVWKVMMQNLHQELVKRDLPSDILVGADSWGDWTWLPARENKKELSGYDFHHYLNDTPDDTYRHMYDEVLESSMTSMVKRIYEEDDTNKPILVTEIAPIGVKYIDWPIATAPAHCRIDTYEYGLGFWDYAIQLTRSGAASGLAWALDGFDQNKNAGMWNNSGKHGGMKLRPWYYTWQLMCRYFPAGATILKMDEAPVSKDLRIGGAKIGANDYSFVVINRRASVDSKDQEVVIKADGGAKMFYVYEYSHNHQGDGYELSLDYTISTTNDLKNEGVKITVPLEGGILITTQPPLDLPDRPLSETNVLDFEDTENYMLLDNANYATTISKVSNPRKREPNVSDNVCRISQSLPTNMVFNPDDAHAYIVLDSLIEVKAGTPALTFHYYRNGYSTTFRLGMRFVDDHKIYGAEFTTENRVWEEKKIDLASYVGKTIESFVVFPNVNYATANLGIEESISIDNIQFSGNVSGGEQLKAVNIELAENHTSICDFTFEQRENSYFLSANQSCGTTSIQTNPSKNDVNSSERALKSTYIFSNEVECKAPDYNIALNPYPLILVTKENPYLRLNILRAVYLATSAIELEFEDGTIVNKKMEVENRRTWNEFDVDLSAYANKVIKNIRLYPYVNSSDDLTGKTDEVFFDNICFESTALSGISEIVNDEDAQYYIDDNVLHILGDNQNVLIYSLEGKLLHRGNTNSVNEYLLNKGIYILSVNGRSYKIIN